MVDMRQLALFVLAAVILACEPSPIVPAGLPIQVGTASAADGAIMIETGDWTYSVPLEGVKWVDQAGTLHESGRPACLASGVTRQIRFAAVEVTVQESTWRPVVWVSCQ
jgi:hypothetical protein